MKTFVKLVIGCVCLSGLLGAQQRFIVRTSLGEPVLRSSCLLLGCNVLYGLDDPLGQLFLIKVPNLLNVGAVLTSLTSLAGLTHSEVDNVAHVVESGRTIPSPLYESEPVPYFGETIRRGYVFQPAVQIVRLPDAQANFNVNGTSVVAVIDTGVDPDHFVLRSFLLPGYDFTRNRGGTASEKADVTQSTAAVVDGVPPLFVNDHAAAILDQSTAAVVDDQDHSAFGHGTMVAGIIHLVAPRAWILPLKAFNSDGTGYTSDILRAIYYAIRNDANVLNMSFSMPQASVELKRALDRAVAAGTVCVASAGNQGVSNPFYPAAFENVIGVASTTNEDARSTFSNYGTQSVWVAAPGEGIVTTYPFGTFAAAWGTSFSTPFVAGTVSLLLQLRPDLTSEQTAVAVAEAKTLVPELGHGRLDIFQALQRALSLP
jgi:hypothetical protein